MTRLLLNSQLAEIITDHGTLIAYVEQIYDTDVLLQVLTKDGTLIEYQTCNYYDIKMVITDTKELKSIEEAVPKNQLPNLFAHGISAKNYILSFARDHNKPVDVYIVDMPTSPVSGIVVDIERNMEPVEESLIKMQILNDNNEPGGNAWVEMPSIDSIRMPAI